jgi:salicylate hydroxylase
MLPFGGQGSNQAIEDGGAIGLLLSNMNHENPLPQLSERLQIFDKIRRKRASRVQILSTVRANREQLVEEQIRKYMEEDVTCELLHFLKFLNHSSA